MSDMLEAKEFFFEWHSKENYITAKTSGSTGKPKTIHLSKDDMRLSAQRTNRYFGITKNSVLYCPLSLNYIAGKMMFVRAEESGAKLRGEEPTLSPLQNYNGPAIDLIAIVPAQIPGLIKSASANNIKIRNIIIGGGPVSTKAEQELIDAGLRAFATYGMTETCSHVALRPLGEEYYTMLEGFSGRSDKRGRLEIYSKDMSFNRLTTNDLVEIKSPIKFKILGRWDNVIISGGEKIIVEEVEAKIAHLFGDRPFYVTARKSVKWGEEAVIITEAGDDFDSEFILRECRLILPRHHVPKDVIVKDRILRGPTGKIMREKI